MSSVQVVLTGCRPEPLASYLKALGVLRIVGEQYDRQAAGTWGKGGFVLVSSLDDQGLEDFLLQDYRPTPIVSPWNNSSGFGPEGRELEMIESSTDQRLGTYRLAISTCRQILDRYRWSELTERERRLRKADLVRSCRSELPDECMPWIDAAVVLTSDGPAYPPLLGTGGNVGRLELSRNFHQRLADVIPLSPRRRAGSEQRSRLWLEDALWALGLSTGIKSSPGQFDPGAAGGSNSSASGKAALVMNPWDFVLMIEGAVMFAAGSARRLGVGSAGHSAAPFCADVAAVGYPGAATETVKGEMWMPLWEGRLVGLPELRRLLAEGRVEWQGRHARTGIDFAKAASTLGVDRGIAAFARYVVAERFGQATVAVPAGRVAVTSTHRRTVLPLAELDPWLDHVRRVSDEPAALRHGLRIVDELTFEVTRGARLAPVRLLAAVAALEAAVSRSTRLREVIRPVSGLLASRWLPALVGLEADPRGTPELRLAIALASAHDRTGDLRTVTRSLRSMLRPIALSAAGVPEWTAGPAVEGFGSRPIIGVLAAAHVRRAVDVLAEHRRSPAPEVGEGAAGLPTRFGHACEARIDDVAALASGAIDEALLGASLAACMLLHWPASMRRSWFGADARTASEGIPPERPLRGPVPPALWVLVPFYARQPLSRPRRRGSGGAVPLGTPGEADAVNLAPEPEWPALLEAGQAQVVLTRALQRLRIAKCNPVARRGEHFAVEPVMSVNLCAALLCPLGQGVGEQMLLRSCPSEVTDVQT